MCLPIDSCFGFSAPRTDDDHYRAPSNKNAPASRGQPAQRNGNGGHYTNGNGYPAHGHAAGADGMLKQQQQHPAAWNGRVAADGHGARGGAPHNSSSSYERAAHREQDAAADSHYPAAAATATADHERY